MPNVVIYCRVSSATQALKGASLEDQESTILRYVREKIYPGITVTYIIVNHVGSAWKKDNLQILKDKLNKDVDMLVCYSLDRLSRSIAYTIPFLTELMDLGINLVSVCDNTDISTPSGWRNLMTSIIEAEFSSRLLSSKIKRSVAFRKRLGGHVGGIPIGKKLVPKIVKDPETGRDITIKVLANDSTLDNTTRLIHDINNAFDKHTSCKTLTTTIRKLCSDATPIQYYDEHGNPIEKLSQPLGTHNIADLLNDFGIAPPSKKKLWTHTTVQKIINIARPKGPIRTNTTRKKYRHTPYHKVNAITRKIKNTHIHSDSDNEEI